MTNNAPETKSSKPDKAPTKLGTKNVARRSKASSRKDAKAGTPAASVNPASQPAIPVTKLTKRDQLAALLLRDEGVTLDQMIAATGWLPHTTRAALTGLKKLGYGIDSDKADGVRTYRAVAPK